MEEIDIWRAAQVLIENYGQEARLIASQRADKAIDQGDPDGERVWKAIVVAVANLHRTQPEPSERIN